MKRLLCMLICLWLPIITHLVADNIPTTGYWDEEEYSRRSFTPARPIASINGTSVSICSPDALNDLNVVITDTLGNIVFQQSYSFEAGGTIDLPIPLEDGEYIIVMTHYWRYLIGEFTVN